MKKLNFTKIWNVKLATLSLIAFCCFFYTNSFAQLTCETATPVAVPSVTGFDSDGAPATPGLPVGGFCGTTITDGSGAWFSITGTGSEITASTCNDALFDTKISVFLVCDDCGVGDCGSLVCVGGNDDGPGCAGFTSEFTFDSAPGSTYYILVHGFLGSQGAGNLTLFTGATSADALTCPPAPDPPVRIAVNGQQETYCYDDFENGFAFQLCPDEDCETVSVFVDQGEIEAGFDALTVFSGVQSDVCTASLVADYPDGSDDLSGTTWAALEGECLWFLFTSDNLFSCVSQAITELQMTTTVVSDCGGGGPGEPEPCALDCPDEINIYLGDGECCQIVQYTVNTTGDCDETVVIPGETILGFDAQYGLDVSTYDNWDTDVDIPSAEPASGMYVTNINPYDGTGPSGDLVDFTGLPGSLTMESVKANAPFTNFPCADCPPFDFTVNECYNGGNWVWTLVSIVAPVTGNMSFAWDYETFDIPGADPFGYYNGPFAGGAGNFVLLADDTDAGSEPNIPVIAGQQIVFSIANAVGEFFEGCEATVTISDLVFEEDDQITPGGLEAVHVSGPLSGTEVCIGTQTVVYNLQPIGGGDVVETCEFDITVIEGPEISAIACNDLVQVSVDENCEALITPDMVLEGGPYGCYGDFTVEVEEGATDGTDLDVVVNMGTWMVTVTNDDTGNSCWGRLLVEDKLPPTLVCTDITIKCTDDLASLAGMTGTSDDIVAATNTFVGTDVGQFLDDGSPQIVESTLTATGGTITDINVNLDLQHTWIGDLDISLTSPGGITVLLFNQDCGNEDDIDASFDDEGSAYVCDSPLTGVVIPEEALSAFDGSSAAGEWTLTIDDTFVDGSDVGSGQLIAWSITISTLDGPLVLASDNCQRTIGDDDFDYYDTTITDGAFCNNTVIQRTWTVTDYAGNTATCNQKITITPIGYEDVNCPVEVVELPCGSGTSMPEIEAYFNELLEGHLPAFLRTGIGTTYAYPWVEDFTGIVALSPSICNIGATKTDTHIPGLCEGDKKVIRFWTILDWCNPDLPLYHCTQVIKVVDHVNPEITISVLGQDITVSTDPWGCAVDFDAPEPEHLSDNCSDPSYRIEVEGGHDLNALPKGSWTLTYIASDDCDNTATDQIVVHVKDETPPVAIAKQNIVVSLTSSSTDGQGIAKLYWQSIDNGSYDGCTDDLYFEIRRADGATTDCRLDNGTCDVRGNNTFSDRDVFGEYPYCSFDTEDGGQYVKFCCADITDEDDNGIGYGLVDVIMRVWDDGDCNGDAGDIGSDNYNDTWATIRVENKLPIQIQCPDDVTIWCYEDVEDTNLTGVATGTGTCDGIDATPEYDYTYVNQCGGQDGTDYSTGVVIITWTIESNGQKKECEQIVRIVVEDPFDVHDITWPADKETDCRTPVRGEPSWNEVPCSLVGSSMEQQVFEFEEDACYKELNHWTIIDWCAYDPTSSPQVFHDVFGDPHYDDGTEGGVVGIWTHTQIVKVIDTSKPVLECVDQPEWATEDCLAQNVELTNSATDEGSDCPSPWLKWEVCLDINYDWSCDHIWTSDEGMATQSRIDEYYYVASSSPGEEITLPVLDDFGNAMSSNEPDELDLPIGTHRVLWTVNDGCGNVASCTQFINVTDGKAPTPYCIQNLSTAVMDHGGTVEIWASDFDLASEDNCTDQDDLLFSFSGDAYVPSMTIECDDLEGEAFKIFDLEMYVWDEAGNNDFCFVQLRVNDNGVCGGGDGRAAISGLLTTEAGDLVDQTNVSLNSTLPEFPIEQMVDGEYAFVENPMYNNYEVTAEKNDNYLNGVSTLDLVLIQKHILGLQLLNSPYKVIAADINSDQGVSALDLVELRKLILGIIEELPNNNSWRFVDASQAFADVNQPWPFTETLAIDDLAADMMSEDFVAAKIGDVSGDAQANLTSGNTEIRTNASLNLATTDRSYAAGDVVRVDITSDEFNDVYGYQFTMNYTGLEYAGVEAGALDMTADNFGLHRTNEGMISTSWASSESVSTSEVLFSVIFTATANGQLSESISIGSAITPAEAYRGSGLSVENVSIEFRTDNGSVSGIEYALYQNEPNPFASATVIGFELPNASEATISVYDVTGKVIKVVRGDYAKGYNEVSLERNELNSAGVLYYQLESGEYTATKKMILID